MRIPLLSESELSKRALVLKRGQNDHVACCLFHAEYDLETYFSNWMKKFGYVCMLTQIQEFFQQKKYHM